MKPTYTSKGVFLFPNGITLRDILTSFNKKREEIRMSLYLAESVLSKGAQERYLFEKIVNEVIIGLEGQKGALIEVQAANDLSRAFFIIESDTRDNILGVFREVGIPITLIKNVRLVGQELDDIRQNEIQVKYVVEWNLPEGLTMDKYLARKKEKSPLYAKVPESSFLRTYVCEDMTKCLCFYDAPDEQFVRKARDVVEAPVDSITELININKTK